MSFISRLKRLYRNLLDARRYARSACKVAALINSEVQKSNANDSIKAQSAAFVTTANALCAAIEVYISDLPGNDGSI